MRSEVDDVAKARLTFEQTLKEKRPESLCWIVALAGISARIQLKEVATYGRPS
jgi:hypothetical protein